MAAPWARGAQARIHGQIHGQQTVNVINFATNTVVSDGPPTDVLLLQLAAALLDCAITTLLPAVSSDWRLISTDARGISPTASDPVVSTAPAAQDGQKQPTSVSFCASLLTLRTGGGGRRGTGRMFLPPPGEPFIVNSTLDASIPPLLLAFGACLLSKFGGEAPSTDWRIGILSRTALAASGGTFDGSFRQVTSITPSSNCAVMRSRRIGHGG